ncbi:2-polyprenyl-6-methoxyphenol hydroxylase [Hahella sp. CCB-MM4]|uniref:FAD-dependent monooxygenase n=1 Tax=Hahella sp. (strain CCB-MM4) TaxID=1926491 RepID=UPI000B9B05AB|nr:FAD-dependent monooxygenase [Hahella sp. CCB-MM4]OZG75070.1 2-polyprenyl-6-methoxyphenol hydroxylase [Hahella sp. CCB-MM4]
MSDTHSPTSISPTSDSTPPQELDVVIVGGGMVGGAVATALLQTNLSIGVIEKKLPQPFDPEAMPDLRVSALNHGSENFLRGINAWSALQAMRSQPYRRLAVWEKLPDLVNVLVPGQPNRTEFNAEEVGASHLGYIVENRVIQLALQQQWQPAENVTVFEDVQVNDLLTSEHSVDVKLSNGQTLRTKLVIGADGANSTVRQKAQLGLTSDAYNQHAMVISVVTDGPDQDITWQEFTSHGPRAYLPLPSINGSTHASLVWYDHPDRLATLLAMDEEALIRAIHKEFPESLPQVRQILGRGSFPLVKRHAQHYYRGRVVLAGDSAHTINPLAGQGVNLGFQDAKVLTDGILKAVQDSGDPGNPECLAAYENNRRPANFRMMTLMDGFYYTFSNDLAPVKLIRNLGLTAAGHLKPAKRQVLKYAMGLS